MVNRFLEVMALALLVVLTIGTTFQVLNFQLLREVQEQLRDESRRPVAVNPPAPQAAAPTTAPPVTEPQPSRPSAPAPATVPQVAKPTPAPAPAPEQQQPETSPPPPSTSPKPIVESKPEPKPQPKAPSKTDPPPPVQSQTPPPAISSAASKAWEEHRAVLEEVITQLYEGSYGAVTRRFTPDLAESLTQDLISRIMEKAVADHGTMKSIGQGRLAEDLPASDSLTFRIPVRTAKDHTLLFSVSVTRDKRVSGLLFKQVNE